MDKDEIVLAVRDYFGNTNRSPNETARGLEEIRDECSMLILTLDEEECDD